MLKIRSIHDILKFLPIVGILLYSYIIYKTGVRNIIKAFSGIKIIWLIPIPILIIAIVLLKGLKWKLILNHYKQDFSYKNACMTWCIGAFAGSLTPGQAGEAIKAIYVRKINPDKSLSECISTIFSDKVLEMFSLMTLVMISSVILVFRQGGSRIGLYVFILAFAMVISFYGMTDQKIYNLLKRLFRPITKLIIPNRYRQNINSSFERFFLGIWELKKEKRLLAYLWLMAIFTWFIVFAVSYFVAISLGLNISFLYMMIISPVITFFAILPISLSGLGTRDASAIFFFNQIGIMAESAVAWSIMVLVVSWCFSLFGWIVSLNPSFWLGLSIDKSS